MYRNRVGDILLLFSVCVLFSSPRRGWRGVFLDDSHSQAIWGLVLARFTKSAQFPFSCWLPEAMAAPTPVRSLVHSSTLVTAGYFLLYFRYRELSSHMLGLAVGVRGYTLLRASLFSLGLIDIKKLVALSTLSQIALLFFTLGVGAKRISLLHILRHALFKSSLFISVGGVLHFRSGSQDFRFISSLSMKENNYSLFFMAILGLVGASFLTGFYSKEAILLRTSQESRLTCLAILSLGVLGTLRYS
jgi:NADH:ubiquinone oxidoreductase subunit 5 (subunit L)/multisubunit Na+/H+ antiporter MnhA subunit